MGSHPFRHTCRNHTDERGSQQHGEEIAGAAADGSKDEADAEEDEREGEDLARLAFSDLMGEREEQEAQIASARKQQGQPGEL